MGANGTSHSPRPREDEMRYLNSGGRQRKMILHSGGVGGNFMFLISISEYSWYSMHGSPMLSMPGPVSFSLTHKVIFWRLRDTCYNTLGFLDVQFSSVQSLSHVWLCDHRTAACQASTSITNSWSYSNSCSLSWWCHPTISSSAVPFSCCLQSFPASGSFPLSGLFPSGG